MTELKITIAGKSHLVTAQSTPHVKRTSVYYEYSFTAQQDSFT